MIAEVDLVGNLVQTRGEGVFEDQHDPIILPDGNLLLANHGQSNEVIELEPDDTIIWQFEILGRGSWPVRDATHLKNGNTLITASDRILEVTPDKQIVWQFRLAEGQFTDRNATSGRGFYKAERLCS